MSFSRFLNNSTGGSSSGFARFSNQQQNEDPYSLDKLNKQIDNVNVRIQDAGYKPQDGDRRNWFEKLTNLPQKQNWFFDAMDLLGRPAQAVMNVIDKQHDGTESVGQAAWRGLAGKDRVRGTDLADNMGVKNGFARFLVGTGLEIGLDPTTYIPGGVIAKGVKSSAGMVAKPLKAAYGAAESLSPALKTFRETKLATAADSAKDALGYMFKPGYKQDKTLFGESSDFLKNAQQTIENSRRYNGDQLMKGVQNAASSVGVDKGVDVGRYMEKDLHVNGPKMYREIPNDPKVVESAQTLMDQNSQLRQIAADNEIDIPELAGYMTHILSKEERDQRGLLKPKNLDKGQFGSGNPNKKILNARKYEGSVEDVNQQVGRKLFEPNAFFASAVGQQRLNDYIHAVSMRRQVLSNPEFSLKYEDGMTIPKDAEVIDTANYKFMKPEGDVLEGTVPADKIGGKYVVTKAAKQILDRYQHINTDEGTKAFLKAMGSLQGTWKKLALFSPGFHIRNVAGAGWNMYAAGMNPYNITKYATEATDDMIKSVRGSEPEMLTEFRKQGLGSGGMTKTEYGDMFKDPAEIITKQVERSSMTGVQKVKDAALHPFQTSRAIGEKSDETMKYALYKWARSKGDTPEQAARRVKETLFDYSELTPFEQKLKLLIPFYTWTRKNIPFQVQKFIEDPRKFANLNKIRLNAQSAAGIDDKNQPGYMKESLSIPVYGKEGKGKMLGLNLPAGDLTKLSSPLKILSDGITPLIKTPIELASNYNLFRGKPIQKFEGQDKQYQVPGTGIQFGIPIKTAYALEQATGQVGRNATEYLQKPESVDQENKFRTPSFGINSMVKDFDAAKNAYYEKLAELKQLQDLMLYIQQQEGAKPRTLAEIKNGKR